MLGLVVKLFFCMIMISLASCSSITKGNKQKISIRSNVVADVYVDGDYVGTTPFNQEIIIRPDTEMELRRKGYASIKWKLKTKIHSSFWWNLGLTTVGLTGMTTDFGSGSYKEYSPSRFYVNLKTRKPSMDEERVERFNQFKVINEDILLKKKIQGLNEEYLETFIYMDPEESKPAVIK